MQPSSPKCLGWNLQPLPENCLLIRVVRRLLSDPLRWRQRPPGSDRIPGFGLSPRIAGTWHRKWWPGTGYFLFQAPRTCPRSPEVSAVSAPGRPVEGRDPRGNCDGLGVGADYKAAGQSLISQRMAPAETVAPTSAVRAVTVPDLWALRGCSIFMASSTTMRSPSATVAPSSTAILTMVPCMGEVRESPDVADPLPALPARRAGFFFELPAAAPPAATAEAPRPAGSTTSRRLPPTSTVTFSRSPGSGASAAGPSYGGIWLSN